VFEAASEKRIVTAVILFPDVLNPETIHKVIIGFGSVNQSATPYLFISSPAWEENFFFYGLREGKRPRLPCMNPLSPNPNN
jgi:hypothetical protein